jgi:hypothetical protein
MRAWQRHSRTKVHHVWLCEESWRFYDRIELALRSPSGSRGGDAGETR